MAINADNVNLKWSLLEWLLLIIVFYLMLFRGMRKLNYPVIYKAVFVQQKYVCFSILLALLQYAAQNDIYFVLSFW